MLSLVKLLAAGFSEYARKQARENSARQEVGPL